MICRVCKYDKDMEMFSKDRRAVNGYRTICKPCEKQYKADHPPRGFDTWADYRREYFRKNYNTPEGRMKHNSRMRAYYDLKKDNPDYKIRKNMRNLLYRMIKEEKYGNKWQDILGYSVDELKNHLESLFDENMRWENYGTYWHIDHIIPSSYFKHSPVGSDKFKKCWSLDNLQPLERIANIRKSNKYNDVF